MLYHPVLRKAIDRFVGVRQGCRSYSMALCRQLPDSFANALAEHHLQEEEDVLSMDRARQQHATYVQALRRILPVLELPQLPDYPDCVFVEDTFVAIGKKAVLTQPGHPNRRGEVSSIAVILQQLGLEIVGDMRKSDAAYCDGGDVLYTGSHLFVGLSDRTNEAGAQVLQQAFSGTIVVPPTMQGNQVLHLKSAVTHMNEDTLVAPVGPAGDAVLESLQATARGYSIIRVPDVLACNVVSVNGTVIVQDTPCVESRRTLEAAVNERNLNLVWVNTSELAKKDAALTCCSVLLDI
jgi:dimethylargininase